MSGNDRIFKVKTPIKKVDKGWGYELHIVNNDMYCGKILHFENESTGSLHFHLNKHETFYILKGCVKITGVNPDTGEQYVEIATEGNVISIPQGVVHQIFAISTADIMEISTPDDPNDSYRVMKGDSQNG